MLEIQDERTNSELGNWDKFKKSLFYKYVCMQYEYGLQEQNSVAREWNNMCEIKIGDMIFL